MRKVLGFTLVELMIVVAIIGILGAIAYPSYQNYVREARRTDGQAAVLALAAQQEKFYLSNNTYSNAVASIWTASGGAYISNEGFYVLAVSAGSATDFTVTATAQGVQTNDTDCRVFSVNSAGAKSAADSTGADSTNQCW